MVALSYCAAPAAILLASVQGARMAKRRSNTKFISGVPIVNYHAAYRGQAGLSVIEESREEDWIVTVKRDCTDAQIESICKSTRNGCQLMGHPDEGGVPFFEMSGTEGELEEVIKQAGCAIEVIEPNQEVQMIPELEVGAAASTASWGLARVGANGRSEKLGSGVSIYILDTGVRTSHEDFGDRAFPEADYSGRTPVYCAEGDMQCAADRQGHGTHCAGSAGGTSFGVASEATIYGVKVLGDNGSGSFAAIMGAVDYLAASDRRPAVGSMSLGGSCWRGNCDSYSSMATAIDRAVESGVTIVVAGGNSNRNACGFVPAFVPSAITVGSTDSNDNRSGFSNYGSCTNIWAPGSAIKSASHSSDTGVTQMSGTSMAAPHVAGGAAMVLEEYPDFLAEQVLEKMHARAATNYIRGLKNGDVNKLLYVASDAPPEEGDVEWR